MTRVLIILSLALSASLAATPAASAEALKPSAQATIIAKLASFDSKISKASSKSRSLRIAVLSDESTSKRASAIVKAFNHLASRKVTVKGRRIQAVVVSDGDLSNARLVYIPSGLSDFAESVKKAREAGLPTIGDAVSSLSQGISFCVVASGGRPAIHISKSGIRGRMSIDAKLLRLAKLHP
jgi:hypothetical protein